MIFSGWLFYNQLKVFSLSLFIFQMHEPMEEIHIFAKISLSMKIGLQSGLIEQGSPPRCQIFMRQFTLRWLLVHTQDAQT